MKLKRILAAVSASLMISGYFINNLNFAKAANDDYYTNGDLEVSQSQEEEFYSQFELSESGIDFDNIPALPSRCDLSTSKYFPPIGDQGNIGSCVSWATTYYQFTYMANKLNDIETTSSNA